MTKESHLTKFKFVDKKFILFLKKSIIDIKKMTTLVKKEKQHYKLDSILKSNYKKSKSLKKKKKKKKGKISFKGGSSNNSGWETTNSNYSEWDTISSSNNDTSLFDMYKSENSEWQEDYTFYPSDSYDIQLLFIITLLINGITTANENMFIFAFKVTCDLIANISINIKKWLLNYKYKKSISTLKNTYIFKFIEIILQIAYKILVYLFTKIKLFVNNNKFKIITGICIYYYRYDIFNYMIITSQKMFIDFIKYYLHEELNSYIRTIFLEWIKTNGKALLLDQSKELSPYLIKELMPALTNSIMPSIQAQLPPMIQNVAIELIPNIIEHQIPALLEPIVIEALENALKESAKNAAQEKIKNAAIMYGTEKVVEAGLMNWFPQLAGMLSAGRQIALL